MDPELYENLSMKKKDKAILKIWGLIWQNLIGHLGLQIKQCVHHADKEKEEKEKGKRQRGWSAPGWRRVHILRGHKQSPLTKLERKEKLLKNDDIVCQSHSMQWPCDPEFPRQL